MSGSGASRKCPLCGETLPVKEEVVADITARNYGCYNCGSFAVEKTIDEQLASISEKTRAVLSHAAWKKGAEGPFSITSEVIDAAMEQRLPDPFEQYNNFILYIGEELERREAPGALIPLRYELLRAKIGALSPKDVAYAAKSAVMNKLLLATYRNPDDIRHGHPPSHCSLSLDGWQRFHDIKRGAVTNRTAFMAMPFGDDTLRQIVDEVFRPAVAETGFALRRVDDEPKAGVIDDKLRVDIRKCRFLIAELTGGNQGVYWEAGYAEGLGKPVIYTCSQEHFKKTHFDTNHCHTVLWDPNNPLEAAEGLKATIRATLPFEATMEDAAHPEQAGS